jgi:hypothetical protein
MGSCASKPSRALPTEKKSAAQQGRIPYCACPRQCGQAPLTSTYQQYTTRRPTSDRPDACTEGRVIPGLDCPNAAEFQLYSSASFRSSCTLWCSPTSEWSRHAPLLLCDAPVLSGPKSLSLLQAKPQVGAGWAFTSLLWTQEGQAPSPTTGFSLVHRRIRWVSDSLPSPQGTLSPVKALSMAHAECQAKCRPDVEVWSMTGCEVVTPSPRLPLATTAWS